MPPPPSTPAPHRFLVPKRSATQRNETPKLLRGGTQQFHATPRFSLHSTPREPAASLPSSTPARPVAFARQRQTDSISDVVDSSPPDIRPSKTFSDSIEAESITSSSVAPAFHDGYHVNDSDFEEDAPLPKRRRLSVSSGVEDEPALPSTASVGGIEGVESTEELVEDPYATESPADSDEPESPGVSAQQPVFHRAPRFIPVEQPEASAREPLPDVFSPRRRGTKDLPGGLAAEVRDWLMEIEANTGSKRDGDFIANISVEEFRLGSGMVLVKGRSASGDVSSTREQGTFSSVRVMLAGEGRLVGLARRNEVVVGSLVAIAKPVWEVILGVEGRWVVACDWVVL
ncbi:hypothetical protein AB5N19_09297 [Seiridium cardinale]|uniref:Uncharacterized protein n=1 Tax=Seiridium cardinale TaxID=138064 RepID=A0ABR2Y7L2_9PEZI